MRAFYLHGLMVAALLAFSPSVAFAKASCEDLDNMISDLDGFADALEDWDGVPDPALDAQLRALVVDARDLSADENDTDAASAANGMIDGWNDGNASLYLRSSDQLADRLEYFLDRDC